MTTTWNCVDKKYRQGRNHRIPVLLWMMKQLKVERGQLIKVWGGVMLRGEIVVQVLIADILDRIRGEVVTRVLEVIVTMKAAVKMDQEGGQKIEIP